MCSVFTTPHRILFQRRDEDKNTIMMFTDSYDVIITAGKMNVTPRTRFILSVSDRVWIGIQLGLWISIRIQLYIKNKNISDRAWIGIQLGLWISGDPDPVVN